MSPRKPKYTELTAQIAAVKGIREWLAGLNRERREAINIVQVIAEIDAALTAK